MPSLSLSFCVSLSLSALSSSRGLSLAPATSAGPSDFHYPSEEASERASAPVPTVSQVGDTWAVVTPAKGGPSERVEVGHAATSKALAGWRLVGVVPHKNAAVVEYLFPQWGMTSFLFAGPNSHNHSGRDDRSNDSASGWMTAPSSAVTLRKAVGELSGIQQPWFNFSASESNYFTRVAQDPTDFPANRAKNLTEDGEPAFAALAATLAPQRDIAAIRYAGVSVACRAILVFLVATIVR